MSTGLQLSKCLKAVWDGWPAKPATVADDLPPVVQQLIVRVTKRTRLWLSERRDVRGELVSHFCCALDELTESGLSRDEAARLAIQQFGDPRVAARLIRRAKKRGRPAIWKLYVRTSQALVLSLITLVLYVMWIWTGRPTPSVDYVAKLNAPSGAISESDRAWPILREAFLAWTPMPYELFKHSNRLAYLTPKDEVWPLAVSWVEANRHLVEDIRRASHCRIFGYPYDNRESLVFRFELEKRQRKPGEPVVSTQFVEPKRDPEDPRILSILGPPLSGYRDTTRFQVLNARIHLAAGEMAAAREELDSAHRLALQLLSCHFVNEQITAAGNLRLISEAIRSELYEAELTGSKRAMQVIRDSQFMAASIDTMQLDVAVERYMFQDAVQYLFTDNGHGDGHLIPKQINKIGFAREGKELTLNGLLTSLGLLHAGRRETLTKFDELWNQMRHLRSLPLYDPTRKQSDALIKKLRDDPTDRYRYALIINLMPSLDRADELLREAAMQQSATQAVVALLEYRNNHGQFPDHLERLVPDYLPQVVVDAYSGQELRYSVNPDGGMQLYSVGQNLVDDQGSNEPRVAANSGKSPADIVYWPPTPPKPKKD